MDNNSSYTSILKIEFNKKNFPVGLCLACTDFEELKRVRKELLHPLECLVYEEMSYRNRQYGYLIGRYCAKRALNAITQKKPSELFIDNGVFHQPLVSLKNIQVSISHTESLGGAISFIESFPMAIDVESLEERKEKTIYPLLSDQEHLLVSSCDSTSPMIMFWTIKEALSKAIKCGLSVPLDLLEIESIQENNGFYISSYKNFSQYQAISFFLTNAVCTIAFPKNTSLHIDVPSIQNAERNLIRGKAENDIT
ncbi:MAG: hypothetical protein BGO77_00995 [Caedibacter sp. 37-49]|nr:MAG: hypothetical protein BGO77_00995 [Caedibacter sp. 37-49]